MIGKAKRQKKQGVNEKRQSFIPSAEPEKPPAPTPALLEVCPQCGGLIPEHATTEPFCTSQHRMDFGMETDRLRQREAELASALDEVRQKLKGRLS